MKKLLIIAIVILCTITVFGTENNIFIKKADINGDGIKETLELKENNDNIISLILKDKNSKTIAIIDEIDESWYSPEIEVCDIDSDNISEIMVIFGSGGSIGGYNYYLYKINGRKIEEVSLPEDVEIEVNIKKDRAEFYSKELNKKVYSIYNSELKNSIQSIKDKVKQEKQETSEYYLSDYLFCKNDGEIKLCVDKTFFYGTDTSDTIPIVKLSLRYSFEKGKWELKEMKKKKLQ